MSYSVLVTQPLPGAAQDYLLDRTRNDVQLVQWPYDTFVIPRDQLLSIIAKGYDGILCFLTEVIDEEFLNAAGPQLKVVSTMSSGYDHVDTQALQRRGIRLGNTPDVLTDATAELTVALVLIAMRRLTECINAVKQGKWVEQWSATWMLGSQLTGKIVGFVGFGRIGRATAIRLIPFGISRILYYNPCPLSSTYVPSSLSHAEHIPKLYQLLSTADIVIVCAPLTPHNHGLFDETAFKSMKPSAIFVNTARGKLVKEEALVKALKEGWIQGAALDVTEVEPLDVKSELLTLDNCIVLPHVGSSTWETREAMGKLAVDNLLRGVKGEVLAKEVVLRSSPSCLDKK